MEFIIIIYLLIGIIVSSFICGFADLGYDGFFILGAILWPMVLICISIIGVIFLFHLLGENFRNKFFK